MTDNWKHIVFAPRDGTRVRLRDDEGKTYTGDFSEPCWWVIARSNKGSPIARIADDVLCNPATSVLRAVQYQEISQ